MQHPAELKVHKFLQDVLNNEATLGAESQQRIVSDVAEALKKQFSDSSNREFSLRMSNTGRPSCQLWYGKNKPEAKQPFGPNFLMNMLMGDIVEAIFKGILTEAGVSFEDGHQVTLEVGKHKIKGTHDLVCEGRVDDIKSASPWSYDNKFADWETLARNDSFGYVSQLVGYAEALGVEVGGWWVINKANGGFKYVDAEGLREPERYRSELKNIEARADTLEENVFFRCYPDEEETFRKKPTGNRKLSHSCEWCDFKRDCWPDAKLMPSIPSTAKSPPMVWYTHIAEEDANG